MSAPVRIFDRAVLVPGLHVGRRANAPISKGILLATGKRTLPLWRMATLGYDAALLTIRVARDWKPGTAFPAARLADTGGFLGLDGPFRFNANGVVERSLEVREARAGSVAVVSPAPERFTD